MVAILSAEHASLGHLLVFSVLVGRVSDNVIIRLGVVLHRHEIGCVWRIDGDWISLKVFACHDIQRQGANVSIWVLLALGQVSDEGRDVFLELGEVHGDIVLVELRILVVLLVAGHCKLESGVAELGDHGPDIVANSDHLVLNIVDLAFLGSDLSLAVVDFLLQVALGLLLLLAAHGVDLSMSLELILDVAVLLLDEIDLTVEHVHVVKE